VRWSRLEAEFASDFCSRIPNLRLEPPQVNQHGYRRRAVEYALLPGAFIFKGDKLLLELDSPALQLIDDPRLTERPVLRLTDRLKLERRLDHIIHGRPPS
jgi:hypothetical protein